MQITGITTTVFNAGENLFDFIERHRVHFKDGDVLVVTSKIIALSENRIISLNKKDEHIRNVAQKIIQTPWATLTYIDSEWSINAGADESNAEHGLILLPLDSFRTARALELYFKKKHSLNKFGVIISDTRSIALRQGTLGRAIGFSGFKPLKSYVGKKDLFGRKSRITKSNHADALAAAAVCVMGEGTECKPLAIIHDAPVVFTSQALSASEKTLSIVPEQDIFSYVFRMKPRQPHKPSK